jgi:hypothetical protein
VTTIDSSYEGSGRGAVLTVGETAGESGRYSNGG